MDGNIMRWLGVFLCAIQFSIPSPPIYAVRKRKIRQRDDEDVPVTLDHNEVHHHQACAIVERLIDIEKKNASIPDIQMGESEKEIDEFGKKSHVQKKSEPPSIPQKKWKLGPKLTDHNDRFAYIFKELERLTGPPMEIKINSVKDIFRPPRKLGEKE